MKPLEIKGMKIGEGVPKTIVSLMDAYVESLLVTVDECKAAGVDCLEWRADFAADVHNPITMVEGAKKISAACPDNPLLFTFRSAGQGGQLTIPVGEYVALNRALIESECIDLVDIETWIGDAAVLELISCAKQHGIATVVSYHNFKGTPSVDWMVGLLTHMQDLGADIPKIAVMAQNPQDSLRLLAATEEMARVHAVGPLLTMAMGRAGSITRLAGELFGSALTFCSLHDVSAPGQVDVAHAKSVMMDLHSVFS